jgi:hypothetical protein
MAKVLARIATERQGRFVHVGLAPVRVRAHG